MRRENSVRYYAEHAGRLAWDLIEQMSVHDYEDPLSRGHLFLSSSPRPFVAFFLWSNGFVLMVDVIVIRPIFGVC